MKIVNEQQRIRFSGISGTFRVLGAGLLFVCAILSVPQKLHAQDATSVTNVPAQQEQTTEQGTRLPYHKQTVNPTSIPPLLFTKWEYEAILDALRAVGKTPVKKPSASELRESEELDRPRYKVKPPPEERDITLNGIVYGGKKDWTIWLNGERITPQAVPEEVIDLRVYEHYIEIKWYDEYSQSVYPIRLKPHQRFNLDTRIFLPG